MAKVKITDNGNVKVTMSVDQWITINAILSNCRMGYKEGMTTYLSEFLTDVEWFNDENCFEDDILEAADFVTAVLIKKMAL